MLAGLVPVAVSVGLLAATGEAAGKPARPDLVVTRAARSPAVWRVGFPVTVTDRVLNRGAAKAGQSRARFYLVKGSQRSRVGGRLVPPLKAGALSDGSTLLRISSAFKSGFYRLVVCADDTHVVAEASEANNCASAPGPVELTHDTTAPTSKASTDHAVTGSASIPVHYTADGTGSALAKVELWVKRPGSGAFVKRATDSHPAPSGRKFTFIAGAGDGPYSFYTRAYDHAGNVEAAPAAADATTTLDTGAPTSSASAPAFSNSSGIRVDYTATGLPLSKVELYAKRPGDSGFALAATDSSPASGNHFDYSAGAGDGAYAFYTRAYDSAGNAESAPAQADATTTLDTASPTSSASAPALSSSTSIPVGYAAGDTGSGLTKVELYAKARGESSFSRVATDPFPGATGQFAYSAGAGDGAYSFYTVAYDRAGNAEAAPASADTTTTLDMAAPSSSASAPGLTDLTTIPVTYSADGTGSPLAKVELYVKRPGDSGFALRGTDSSPASGNQFDYSADAGDGAYSFYTIAYDAAGNVEAAPGSADATTTLDTGAPTSSASAPAFSNSSGIRVDYTATGSPLSKVELYVKRPGDSGFALAATDSSPASGNHFDYSAGAGDGAYAFYTRAYDTADNVEPIPASPDATTTVDTANPSSAATSPGLTNSASIQVAYAADGTGSALDKVELYVKRPGDSGFALAATDSSPVSGAHFTYTAAVGDGAYSFYTVAYDRAGNAEAAPASADTTTTLDQAAPTSAATSTAYTKSTQIQVDYTADGTGSALDKVELYVKRPGDSGFALAATDSSPVSGAHFTYTAAVGDGAYSFYTVAYDRAGNAEAAPASADTTTTLDRLAPSSAATSASLSKSPIQVTYTAGGTGSPLDKVELWVKPPGAGSFSLAATDSSPVSGAHFTYAPNGGDGAYGFYTIAYDKAGNTEAAPSSADTTTTLDATAPNPTITQPANNSSTDQRLIALSGATGGATGDTQSVTVNIYSGSTATGTPIQTPSANVSSGTWSATAAPLDPGTYTAQVLQADAAGNQGQATSTFTVPVTLLAAGDIAGGDGPNGTPSPGAIATAQLVQARSGTVATLGDNAYENGTATEFTSWYAPTWGAFASRTMPAPGNREYNTANATGYFGYFGSAAGDPAKGYYSYDLGAWHIIVVNSSSGCPSSSATLACTSGSPMITWLAQDLAAHQTTCTLAYWHHPRFSSSLPSPAHSEGAILTLWQTLYNGGADVVLNGHKHNYERFAPQDPTANPTSSGIREFVVGTGGRSHELFSSSNGTAANSQASNDSTFGILELTLNQTGYDYKFVPAGGGAPLDSGSGTCGNNGH